MHPEARRGLLAAVDVFQNNPFAYMHQSWFDFFAPDELMPKTGLSNFRGRWARAAANRVLLSDVSGNQLSPKLWRTPGAQFALLSGLAHNKVINALAVGVARGTGQLPLVESLVDEKTRSLETCFARAGVVLPSCRVLCADAPLLLATLQEHVQHCLLSQATDLDAAILDRWHLRFPRELVLQNKSSSPQLRKKAFLLSACIVVLSDFSVIDEDDLWL